MWQNYFSPDVAWLKAKRVRWKLYVSKFIKQTTDIFFHKKPTGLQLVKNNVNESHSAHVS